MVLYDTYKKVCDSFERSATCGWIPDYMINYGLPYDRSPGYVSLVCLPCVKNSTFEKIAKINSGITGLLRKDLSVRDLDNFSFETAIVLSRMELTI